MNTFNFCINSYCVFVSIKNKKQGASMGKINEKKEATENISVLVIPVFNPEGNWIGNVGINTETMEVIDGLKNGYKVNGN